MLRVACLTLLLAAGCLAVDQSAQKPTNAVKRVINLLSEMKSQLEQEAKDDQELYDKLVCWCETNNKEKTVAVANEEQAIIDLGHAINENVAKEATLTSEVGALKKAIAENQDNLAKATEMREKELQAFTDSERQAVQSISATKNAIKMLEKQNSLSQTSLMQLKKNVPKEQFTKIERSLPEILRESSFLQTKAKQAPSGGSYAPQSGAIFGILQQMLETFEMNTANAKKEEADAVKTFADLKKSKNAEIEAATAQVTSKTEGAAVAGETAATSKQALTDTRAALAADTEFLANLKVTCDGLDRQWAQRTKTRADETAAVSDTIAILTEDDNSELMGSSLGFLQEKQRSLPGMIQAAREMEARAREVSRILRMKPGQHPASMVQTSKRATAGVRDTLNPAFAKVKDSVAKMKADLKDQKKEEVATNDECIAELRQLEVDMTAAKNDKEDAETKVADCKDFIAGVDGQVKALKAGISETQVEMKKASEDRELENKEFQAVVTDQRATQAVLKKAVDRLKDFYEKKVFLQTGSKTVPSNAMRLLDGFIQESKQMPPGGGFEPYKKKGGAGGVMGMIEDLVADSAKLEAEAVAAEKEAQTSYEKFIADSNASVDADTKEISNLAAEKGKKEEERTQAQADADAGLQSLVTLGELGGTIHKKCDFLLKNFGARQDALASEMTALDQSMAMLSGA